MINHLFEKSNELCQLLQLLWTYIDDIFRTNFRKFGMNSLNHNHTFIWYNNCKVGSLKIEYFGEMYGACFQLASLLASQRRPISAVVTADLSSICENIIIYILYFIEQTIDK